MIFINLPKVKVLGPEKVIKLVMVITDILKREEVNKVYFVNFLSTITERNLQKQLFTPKNYVYVYMVFHYHK